MIKSLSDFGLPPNEPALWLILALVATTVVGLMLERRQGKRARRFRADLERTRLALAAAEANASEHERVKTTLEVERVRRATLEAHASAKDATIAERERALKELKERYDAEFKAATAQMLEHAHQAFLARAKETFERYSESASADGEKRSKALDELLRPVSESLVRYEKGLTELRAEQQQSRGELAGQIGALAKSTLHVRMEAQKLAAALRAGPKTRGRWGEEQLRNVVEIAGMAAYVDFTEQTSHDDGEKRKTPDMIVRLPGGRIVAIDSKVSLTAYLDASDAETDDARAALLARHADDLWAHVKSLSAKDYAASLRDAMDYVVMFVPGENYFSAALEMRPQLYQDAFDRKILIATPTILIAMLKSAALNWRQEKMTENARAVAAMAKDLYDSLRRMGENLGSLGRSIDAAVRRYNDVVANVEGRVMPRARKFADYEIPGVEASIEEIAPLETATRELRAGRDLALRDEREEQDDAA